MPRSTLLWPLAGVGLARAARRALRSTTQSDLNGHVAFITGGSRGLGLAIARELAREGCALALCARDADELERARGDVSALGADVLTVVCDVTDRGQVGAAIRQTFDRFGRLDILVNNAGVISVGPLETYDVSDFERSLDVMFWGTIYPTFEVLPHMRQRRAGHIVNITSIGGKMSVPHLLPYSSAKFATVGFSEGLHAELAPDGIHVLTVVPGLMRTGSHVNAEARGRHRQEFAWFGLAATLPFTSISAADAARQVVSGIKHGDAELILGWQAALAARIHALSPGLSARVLGLFDRLLPGPGDNGRRAWTGEESRNAVTSSPLTALGERAADDLNQR
jgi:NAD(P)-dependent dehydrogenase (short-subunit alcohol dehydrogenase family)